MSVQVKGYTERIRCSTGPYNRPLLLVRQQNTPLRALPWSPQCSSRAAAYEDRLPLHQPTSQRLLQHLVPGSLNLFKDVLLVMVTISCQSDFATVCYHLKLVLVHLLVPCSDSSCSLLSSCTLSSPSENVFIVKFLSVLNLK